MLLREEFDVIQSSPGDERRTTPRRAMGGSAHVGYEADKE